jgi:spore coat protein A
MEMRQADQWLGLYGTDADENPVQLQTTIWGYGLAGTGVTYPGPTLVAEENEQVRVNWMNHLPVSEGHLLPVDDTIHLAEPIQLPLDLGFIATVTHLHGGHTRSDSDGIPEAWFTQGHGLTGDTYETKIYTYDNTQEAATLWYHDHALGITRLNVYAGLAGFYRIEDENEQDLIEDGVLPSRAFDTELVIQDRAFTADGDLYYPAFEGDPIPGTDDTVSVPDHEDFPPDAPTILPEFFGDFILVNGMAWPNYDVAQGDHRFRLLNGSDSRFYVLEFGEFNEDGVQIDGDPVEVTLIGTDGGLLPQPIIVMDGNGEQEDGEQILLAPGDRVEVVADFSTLDAGSTVRLLNTGPEFEPFGNLPVSDGAEPDDPVGNVMQFTVTDAEGEDVSVNDFTDDDDAPVLNPDYAPVLAQDEAPDHTRLLGLFEILDSFGRIQPALGVAEQTEDINGDPVAFGPLDWFEPITETPALDSKEVWRIFNFTEDAHPIHLHLVQFEVLGKNKIFSPGETEVIKGPDGLPIDANDDDRIDIDGDIVIGSEIPLAPEDTGAQDTVWVGPNEVLDIAAEFDRPGRYVWHCHILSHEDHEMMRPFEVIDPNMETDTLLA